MNKKVMIGIIITFVAALFVVLRIVIPNTTKDVGNALGENIEKSELEIKTNKETIYELFSNFPESNNIYYISKNLYNERSVGPTIYQIDILAELTDDAYKNIVNQIKFEQLDNFEIKVNPHNKSYNWKKIKNTNIIESKNNEIASIKNIYLDENTKTIYVTAMGGN